MGKMGDGYGSEFHLRRYLGHRQSELNRAVEKETGGRVIEWLDLAAGGEGKLNREWRGVDFVDSASDVKSAWVKFWPQTGNVPNWDAVGRLESNSGKEYLLVEAKAHAEELRSSCLAKEAKKEARLGEISNALKATKEAGLEKIKDALNATITANGFTADVKDWLSPYYQYANRLAHLHFLVEHGIPARLVFIYFYGDNWRGKTLRNGKPPNCPKEAQQWDAYVKDVHERLGMNGHSKLEQRVHSLFLSV